MNRIHYNICNDTIKNTLWYKFKDLDFKTKRPLEIEEVGIPKMNELISNLEVDIKKVGVFENDCVICEYFEGSFVFFQKKDCNIFFYSSDNKHNSIIITIVTIYIYLWFSTQGILWLHSSAMNWKCKTVVVLGNSGSGKSTILLSSLREDSRLISEENTFVDSNNDYKILINKHAIAILESEINKFPKIITNNTCKNEYIKENKISISIEETNYIKELCNADVVILLSDEKKTKSEIKKLNKYQAICGVIKLHPCFHNYVSEEWYALLVGWLETIETIYELIPSNDILNTTEVIFEKLRGDYK